MEKLIKNIQWIILILAGYNLYSTNAEYELKPEEVRVSADKIRQKIAKNKKVQKEIDEFYKNIEEAKLKIQKVKESVEKTQQLLPTEISDVEYVKLLRQVGEDLNIKGMKIVPGKEVENGLYISKGYAFTAKATYVQFLVFFERISNNKRVLNIKNVTFSKAGTASRGKIQLLDGSFSLEAYRHNPNFIDSDKPAETAPAVVPPKTSFNNTKNWRISG